MTLPDIVIFVVLAFLFGYMIAVILILNILVAVLVRNQREKKVNFKDVEALGALKGAIKAYLADMSLDREYLKRWLKIAEKVEHGMAWEQAWKQAVAEAREGK
jgi:hypothetical protein